jgi:carbonic anhydrase
MPMPHCRPAPLAALFPIAAAITLALALATGAVFAAAPSATAAKAGGPAASARPEANLDLLRERLAEKLGAVRAAESRGSGTLRVSSKVDATATSTGSGALPATATPRKPPAALLASVDQHRADKSAGPDGAGRPGHWSYGGENGPHAWAALRPEFSQCAAGKRQSPIDIRGGIAVDLDPVLFDYRASGFSVIDNGHTVQVNVAPGNRIEVLGRRFELVQFHFHRPSEERIDGRQFEMDVHLVHRDPEGRLAVVAVLLERGAAQGVVQTVWNNLPLEKGEEQQAGAVLDLNHLLPPDRGYYTYMGSLTTPPCNEGVLWMVMRQPVTVSQGQLDIFSRLYPMNARPVQSSAGRLIKQSQ